MWKHMARCTDNERQILHCSTRTSRCLLSHYHRCKGPCSTCGPVRETIRIRIRENGGQVIKSSSTENSDAGNDGNEGEECSYEETDYELEIESMTINTSDVFEYRGRFHGTLSQRMVPQDVVGVRFHPSMVLKLNLSF